MRLELYGTVRAFVPREMLPSKRMTLGPYSPLPIGCSRTVPTVPTPSLQSPLITVLAVPTSRLGGAGRFRNLTPLVPRPFQAIIRTDAKMPTRSGPQDGHTRRLDSPIFPPYTSLPRSITVGIGRKRGKSRSRTTFLERSRSRRAEGRAGWVGCGSWAFRARDICSFWR